MNQKDLKATNLTDYVNVVTRISKLVCTQKNNNVLLFRGQADKNFDLIPSIGRKRISISQRSILNDERNLIEMAKFKLPEVFHDHLNPIELLALLQHHGIPTRLLDITENALVALYFACASEENNDKDAEVIVFKCDDTNVRTSLLPMLLQKAITLLIACIRDCQISMKKYTSRIIFRKEDNHTKLNRQIMSLVE